MNAQQIATPRAERYAILKEERIDAMWSADEDERRIAFALRAAAGARKALRESKTR